MNFWLDVLPPLLAAVFIWWGATGIIIYLCGRKAWRPWVFGVVTALQPLAFWRLWAERNSTDVGGVFASFFWAIVIWSWVETGYYGGVIVGRKNVPEIEPDTPTWVRFKRAVSANLYHELMIIGLSVAVVIVGWGGSNETGLWAFMILHWTHQSAKINIFLGVNNITTEYLPDNLRYMAQYFTKKPLNSFFPFSVTVSIIIATLLLMSTLDANTAGMQTGQALLFIEMVAAVLEHWWLVTPVPTKTWEWALKSRQTAEALSQKLPTVQIVCGYLGSGKTTLIRHLLPQLDERVAVVVNDFGVVGVDAELIRADGAAGAVVELPGGCVCCTLQKNLTGQLVKLLDDYKPEKVIIEPSGVAGIESIVKALANPRLVGRIGIIEVVAVVEAPRLRSITNLPAFVLTQIKIARSVVISKSDLVSAEEISNIVGLVESLNPEARVISAVQGRVSVTELFAAPHQNHDRAHEHDSSHGQEDGGFISWGQEYTGEFDTLALSRFFEALKNGQYGPVERAKGLFPVNGGRQAWDIAGGQVIQRVLPADPNPPTGRFMVIAPDLAIEELDRQLQSCLISKIKSS